jgi:hypothetical protein
MIIRLVVKLNREDENYALIQDQIEFIYNYLKDIPDGLV